MCATELICAGIHSVLGLNAFVATLSLCCRKRLYPLLGGCGAGYCMQRTWHRYQNETPASRMLKERLLQEELLVPMQTVKLLGSRVPTRQVATQIDSGSYS